MIFISLSTEVEKANRLLHDNAKWCYIGKDICVREKISDVMGGDKRFFLKDMLNKIAEEFSQPYLDFVSKLGKQQNNHLYWWASRFASKSPYQTDFYLLFCYKVLIDRLVADYVKKQQNICIFVEDLWLFYEFTTKYKQSGDVLFLGNHLKVFRNAFLLVCRGFIYRVLVVARLLALWFVTFFYHRARKPVFVQQKLPAVGIVSYGEDRSLISEGFKDPYTGELSDFLEMNNIGVIRPLFLLYPISLSKKVGNLWKTIWPLILDLRFSDFFQIVKYWNPGVILEKDLSIGGFSIRLLLKREILDEFSKTGFNLYLILYRVMKRFFRKKWCYALVYLYENQPFEKIICKAAENAGGIKLIGYQHSMVFKFIFSYFLGEGEREFIPLPDKIITNGSNALNLLKKEGYPSEKLEMGGAWRYTYLLETIGKKTNHISGDKIKLLVILPVGRYMSEFVIKTVIQYYSMNTKIEILIKPHPLMPIEKLNIKQDEINAFEIVSKPFHDIIKEYNIALYCGSTAGVESLLYGKIVIRLMLENYIDIDPLAGFDSPEIIKCYEDELSGKIEEAIIRLKTLGSGMNSGLSEKFFSRIVPEVWLRELNYSACSKT